MATLRHGPTTCGLESHQMASTSYVLLHAQQLAAALLLATSIHTTASAQVGMANAEFAGLPVTLIYPTAQPTKRLVQGSFEIDVAVDAAPTPGPHRLVVVSHGTGGNALADHTMAATLARAGFIVAQPRHAGDNHADASKAGPASWVTRPREISAVIDALSTSPTWRPLLQLDKVGVHGMSAGGGTALVMAGARWRVLELVRHCAENAEEDMGFCFNGTVTPGARAERKASFERARGTPDAYLPSNVTEVHGGREGPDPRPDPRVAAVSAAVPLAAIFTRESLAAIRIPVAIVGASRDQNLLPAFHSQRVLKVCSACVALDELRGAGHFDLLAPWPADVAQRVGAMQVRGGIPEPGFDPTLRQAAFDKIAAFFDRTLRP
jgi:predicted dienelactone hydrolase